MSIMGIGCNTLGYGDDEVDDAVRRAIDNGTMSTLNAPEEVEPAALEVRARKALQVGQVAGDGVQPLGQADRLPDPQYFFVGGDGPSPVVDVRIPLYDKHFQTHPA